MLLNLPLYVLSIMEIDQRFQCFLFSFVSFKSFRMINVAYKMSFTSVGFLQPCKIYTFLPKSLFIKFQLRFIYFSLFAGKRPETDETTLILFLIRSLGRPVHCWKWGGHNSKNLLILILWRGVEWMTYFMFSY